MDEQTKEHMRKFNESMAFGAPTQGGVAQDPRVKDVSPIDAALKDLHDRLNAGFQMVHQLESRLLPVLTSLNRPDIGNSAEVNKTLGPVSLVDRITLQSRRLEQLLEQLYSIHERLQL